MRRHFSPTEAQTLRRKTCIIVIELTQVPIRYAHTSTRRHLTQPHLPGRPKVEGGRRHRPVGWCGGAPRRLPRRRGKDRSRLLPRHGSSRERMRPASPHQPIGPGDLAGHFLRRPRRRRGRDGRGRVSKGGRTAAAAAALTAPAAATAMLALKRRACDATAPYAGAASLAAVSSSTSGGGTAGACGGGSIDSYSTGCVVETRAESTCNVDSARAQSVQQHRRRNRQLRRVGNIAFEEAEARSAYASSRIRNAACACETRFDAIVSKGGRTGVRRLTTIARGQMAGAEGDVRRGRRGGDFWVEKRAAPEWSSSPSESAILVTSTLYHVVRVRRGLRSEKCASGGQTKATGV